jgi:hypothetical protein
MRHPQKLVKPKSSTECSSVEQQSSYRRSRPEMKSIASPMTPSLPGIAFAVLAASLPLLRAKDVTTSTGSSSACSILVTQSVAVASLVRKALPFLFGLNSSLQESSTAAIETIPNLGLIKEQMRIEHLLKRMDQVLNFSHLSPADVLVFS